MSLDILRMLLACDSEGCRSTTKVPIRLRHFYDDSILELRGQSSAAGWVFMSSGMHDKHFCPLCAEKHICPRNGSEIKVQSESRPIPRTALTSRQPGTQSRVYRAKT